MGQQFPSKPLQLSWAEQAAAAVDLVVVVVLLVVDLVGVGFGAKSSTAFELEVVVAELLYPPCVGSPDRPGYK